MTMNREALVAKARADRRGYRRVRVDFKGRLFVPGDEREAACSVTDMSPTGAQIVCDLGPAPNTPVVVYVDGFGRLEATVVRPAKGEEIEGALGVKFNCSLLKRERVAEQLAQYVDHGVVDDTALRRHDRAPAKGLARFTRANGEIVNCEVLDLSLSGVSLGTEMRPPIGEFVLIGQMAGRVVRHHDTGIGITFVAGMPEKTQNERGVPKLNLNR